MSTPPWIRTLSPSAAGLAWGLLAATIWTVYSVLARLGIKSGLSPLDMTVLRFMPGALGWADPRALLAAQPGFVALQAVAHCLGAGLVAILAYSRAVILLGPGRVAFFGAMVPGAAALLAIPVLDEVPTALQVAGLLAVVVGLLLAFGAVRVLLDRSTLH